MKLSLTRTLAVAATAACVVTLTACGAEEQTVDQACEIVDNTMNEHSSALDEALASTQAGDSQGGLDAIAEVMNSLENAEKEVTNPEVKQLTKDLHTSFVDLHGLLEQFNPEGIDLTNEAEVAEYQAVADQMLVVVDDMEAAGAAYGATCEPA